MLFINPFSGKNDIKIKISDNDDFLEEWDLFYFVDLTYPEIKPKRIIQPVFDKGKNMISE